jgi:hypothetical protein
MPGRLALARRADVLLLNPDVRLGPNTVARYCQILTERPDVGALNSIRVCPGGQTIAPKFGDGVLAVRVVPRGLVQWNSKVLSSNWGTLNEA